MILEAIVTIGGLALLALGLYAHFTQPGPPTTYKKNGRRK